MDGGAVVREIHCRFNARMRCYTIDSCPLADETFSNILDVWVLTDREPPSLNWERGGLADPQTCERKTLRKCEVTRLFQWPERVQWFIANGGMTKWLCEDIKQAYFLWRETQDGISLRRAKIRWAERQVTKIRAEATRMNDGRA